MPRLRTLLAAGAVTLGLAALPLAAQPPGAVWSPWGGPDNPGGLLGGDPRDVDRDGDGRLHRDEVWSFILRRLDTADADGDRSLTMQELGVPQADAHRQAWFRAVDKDRNGRLTLDELQALAGIIVLTHQGQHRPATQAQPAAAAR